MILLFLSPYRLSQLLATKMPKIKGSFALYKTANKRTNLAVPHHAIASGGELHVRLDEYARQALAAARGRRDASDLRRNTTRHHKSLIILRFRSIRSTNKRQEINEYIDTYWTDETNAAHVVNAMLAKRDVDASHGTDTRDIVERVELFIDVVLALMITNTVSKQRDQYRRYLDRRAGVEIAVRSAPRLDEHFARFVPHIDRLDLRYIRCSLIEIKSNGSNFVPWCRDQAR